MNKTRRVAFWLPRIHPYTLRLLAWIGAGALLLLLALAAARLFITPNTGAPGQNVARTHPLLVGPASTPQDGTVAGTASAGSDQLPRAGLSEAFYDFGRIPPRGVVERTFRLTNHGDAPLVIHHAFTTCGCTTARISSAVIPPGQVALIELAFDPAYHNMRGSTVRRGLILETNDLTHPLQEIWIQVTITE